MKNLKICASTILVVFALFLTGCGGNSHTLNCTLDGEDEKNSIKMTFNDKEDEVISIEQTIQEKIPSDYSKEEIEEELDYWNSECKNSSFDACSVKVSGNYIVISVTGKPSAWGDEIIEGKIDELREDLENDGFKCSK